MKRESQVKQQWYLLHIFSVRQSNGQRSYLAQWIILKDRSKKKKGIVWANGTEKKEKNLIRRKAEK